MKLSKNVVRLYRRTVWHEVLTVKWHFRAEYITWTGKHVTTEGWNWSSDEREARSDLQRALRGAKTVVQAYTEARFMTDYKTSTYYTMARG